MMLDKDRPAGIQYIGLQGISKSCKQAVERLLMVGVRIEQALLLTAGNTHALLLHIEPLETIAVKSGFSSGYAGEGPRALSDTLQLLEAFGVDADEIEVSAALISRLDAAALTLGDMDFIEKASPVRPMRWHRYIATSHRETFSPTAPVTRLPEQMSWGALDHRLAPAALGFENNPDHALLVGFRQLEDIVRARLGQEVGEGRVFAAAFSGERSKLTWAKVSAGEHNARGQLFTGAYGAFRNPRAHGMVKSREVSALQEFMLLNMLYKLERSAIDRPEPTEAELDAQTTVSKNKGAKSQ